MYCDFGEVSVKFSEGFSGNVLEASVSFRKGFGRFLENILEASASFLEKVLKILARFFAKVSDFRDVSENVLEASSSF